MWFIFQTVTTLNKRIKFYLLCFSHQLSFWLNSLNKALNIPFTYHKRKQFLELLFSQRIEKLVFRKNFLLHRSYSSASFAEQVLNNFLVTMETLFWGLVYSHKQEQNGQLYWRKIITINSPTNYWSRFIDLFSSSYPCLWRTNKNVIKHYC